MRINRERNPINYRHELFKRLTRLFSSPIVNYRAATEKALKRRQMGKMGQLVKSTEGKAFKKQYFSFFDSLQSNMFVNVQRNQRYNDFNEMEFVPEVASILDIYAEEMTTSSKMQPIININCPNEEIKEVLKVLYFDIMNVDFNLPGWARSLCKYGDLFLYLDLEEGEGIKRIIGLPTSDVERLEGLDKTNPDYVQFQVNTGGLTLENWQIAHMRILANDKFAPYGTSCLDSARRIFRQLDLVETAMMAYRIVRAPERRVFYIDVGNIPPQDVETFMNHIMTQMKRNQITSSENGQVDLRFNPLGILDDFYIPVRGGASGTKIESLPGGQYIGDIEDAKYFRDKLFTALKVPASYVSRAEGAEEDKESLSVKDIRFARTIQRLQKSVVSELTKIGLIHLYVLGYRNEDLLSFDVSLNNPSKIAELQELEMWRTKFDVASSATENSFSRRWIAEKIFNISEEEHLRCQREMYYDKWFEAQLTAISEGGEGGGEGLGGGLGGEEDMGGGAELEEPDTDEGGDEEDSILLASPEEGGGEALGGEEALGEVKEPHLSPGAKGKLYYPVTTDKRDMGARKRHLQAKYSKEKSSNTVRNVFGGYSGLKSLGKGITKEGIETIYSGEEREILELNSEIKLMLENLEKADIKEKGKEDISSIIESKNKKKGILN